MTLDTRELNVEIYRLEQWREKALFGSDQSLIWSSSTPKSFLG